MTQSSLITMLNSIPDCQPARIHLAKNNGETLYLDCTYREGTAPQFFLVFAAGKLPTDLDLKQICTLSINNTNEDQPPISLNAIINRTIVNRTLELTAKGVFDPTTLRQYFRVPVYAAVTISNDKSSDKGPPREWSLTGETLDLSGSGLLGIFGEDCKTRQQIEITLQLNSPPAAVSCKGHIVSTRRVRKGRWQIAMHFDDITGKQRDIIISNCLNEQREQLKKGLQP